MSRKNRNARHQNYQAEGTRIFQPPINHVYMIDDKVSYEFVRLPSTLLRSRLECQRKLIESHVQEIVDNFDPRLVNPLKVSDRDGQYNVYDGAHTLAALKRIHKFDNFLVDCKVFHGLTEADENYLFATQDGLVSPVPKAKRASALWLAKDEKMLDLESRANAAGFRIHEEDTALRRIECIQKIEKIYDGDPELVSATLNLMKDTWNCAEWSVRANVIGGVALFLKLYGKEYSKTKFIKQVSKADFTLLKQIAHDVNNRDKDYAFATAILKVYNKGGGKGALNPYTILAYKF